MGQAIQSHTKVAPALSLLASPKMELSKVSRLDK